MKRFQFIVLPDHFLLKNIVELSKLTMSMKSNIYFHRDQITCNGKSLLGLMSFFMPLKTGDSFILSVDGVDAEQAVEQIEQLFFSTKKVELDFWEQEGLEATMRASERYNFKWTPYVRLVAKKYLKG